MNLEQRREVILENISSFLMIVIGGTVMVVFFYLPKLVAKMLVAFFMGLVTALALVWTVISKALGVR